MPANVQFLGLSYFKFSPHNRKFLHNRRIFLLTDALDGKNCILDVLPAGRMAPNPMHMTGRMVPTPMHMARRASLNMELYFLCRYLYKQSVSVSPGGIYTRL